MRCFVVPGCWRGWVYGWKLHLATTVADVWIPLAARLTPANAHDYLIAPLLTTELPEEMRFVLDDSHYISMGISRRPSSGTDRCHQKRGEHRPPLFGSGVRLPASAATSP